jgi:hypothetical protein
MAEILPFTGERRERSRPAPGNRAEIVIFPGVRVEYHDRVPEPAQQSAAKGRSRRRVRPAKDALSA